MKTKHFTILELCADSESPMIGTLTFIPDSTLGKMEFIDRFTVAVKEHFDVTEFKMPVLPPLFDGSPYEDIVIKIDGNDYKIRIIETWIY